MTSISTTITSVTLVSGEHPLAASDLAQACGASLDWVDQLVELGIVSVQSGEEGTSALQFQSTDLQRALEVRRLERDFDVGLEAAALIVDLQLEVRRLKAVLARHGLALT